MTKSIAKTMPAPVLVPIDLSVGSAAALVWAARQAQATGAPLLVVHVVHDPESQPGYYNRPKKKQLRRLEDAAAEMVAEFIAELRREHADLAEVLQVEPQLVIGLPVTRILELAQKHGASQIIMGSHGRTGLSRFMLGSKAEAVARLSPIPVTIVKAEDQARAKS